MASRAATRTFARVAASAARAPLAARALGAAPRFAARIATPAAFTSNFQQARGIKTLEFGGSKEKVYERSDWPKEKLLDYFKNDTIAVLGYGPQGHGQGLNLRDNGLNVIVGVRKDGRSWKKAVAEGWVPGKNLFSIEEAADKGTIVFNLLSDAAQRDLWPTVKPYITPGKTLYFSHGFAITYKDQTHVEAPAGVDVVLCAPKGSGATLRTLFLEGKGLNSSIAVFQDVSGKAHERVVALGVAIGSGYLYETTFEKEVYSDLFGERGVLMGAINGLFRAQYDILRAQGHSPSEAFNETVEEATQSLFPLIGAKGMDWMYANCSVTAQRGALDWHQKFYDASLPVFKELYESVKNGSESQRALDKNSQSDYRESLEEELKEIRESEIWRAGETVRSLRPENNK
ncbi:Bifunctional acetohydroxyacid reductoisomerase [Coemansia spiralis]|uniref:Ketol-acid reductoisomerase, mitochondrial n=2 Tax=Coemansia TaxID=4863 RepID=A0A9W8L1E5_9FUNG|nr:ketol-acid reductoisomerase [Coemansia spiralis]KAJ1996361.1 Bifunctional acetohydroxyacid reductoisomerase [Coemansia umbellata]KAJ2624175.1 Bifunctional acetohydroxyacid reductoisomerase [Coemansia sp. RSA 1358]KAJ2680789.1 Bifunctional acetohydroxyacid reductoisomerase [Coemansia spiralis]